MQTSTLSPKEQKVLDTYLHRLSIPKSKTKQPLAVGIIGLVGSGKRVVAEALAKEVGAVIISADDVRVLLRSYGLGYENVRDIYFTIAREVLKQGGNIIINSDFIGFEKRKKLRQIGKQTKSKILFIRTICEQDILIGRIITEKYTSPRKDLFNGARTLWSGKEKGAVVKIREMWRRTPQHYVWKNEGGGKWMLKKIPGVFARIDTTDMKKMKYQIKEITYRILS